MHMIETYPDNTGKPTIVFVYDPATPPRVLKNNYFKPLPELFPFSEEARLYDFLDEDDGYPGPEYFERGQVLRRTQSAIEDFTNHIRETSELIKERLKNLIKREREWIIPSPKLLRRLGGRSTT
mmetsp:Transcript_39706/g.55127  ORF Transcript_39706/g.55127 Transcript_39706/m.55127 type:complete len:124 (-) Transcript_39706:187-558(-)